MKEFTRKVGNWVEMTYDDSLWRWGIWWYHVKDGFGHKNDREDWVADVEGANISITRWHNEDVYFKGHSHWETTKRTEAMDIAIENSFAMMELSRDKLLIQLAKNTSGLDTLRKAQKKQEASESIGEPKRKRSHPGSLKVKR